MGVEHSFPEEYVVCCEKTQSVLHLLLVVRHCLNITDSPAVKSLLRSMKALEWGMRMLMDEVSAFWHTGLLKGRQKPQGNSRI